MSIAAPRTQRSVLRRAVHAGFLLMVMAIAAGWGRDGHAITGEIAQRELTPEAQHAVETLLDGRPLAEIAAWADQVRRQPEYRWTAPLHYVNIEPGAPRYDHERDCPDHGCAVSAIIKYRDLLADGEGDERERREALKFLVHFIGDLHQPLHAGLERDRGGNDIPVTIRGRQTNLHAAWDSGIMRVNHRPWPLIAEELHDRITDEQRSAWNDPDPGVWANESYHDAIAIAYPIPEDGELDDTYISRAMPTIERRLAMAGIRIAHTLNAVFDGSTPEARSQPDESEPNESDPDGTDNATDDD